MDKNAHGNVLDIFTRQKHAANQALPDKFDYCAVLGQFTTDEPKGDEEFIIFTREAGRGSELIRYADILTIYSPVNELVAITCEHAYFTIEGQYLDGVVFHIQNRKLQILQQYVPEWHHEPVENEPVIYRITRDPENITDEELTEWRTIVDAV